MKTIIGTRKQRYLVRVGIFLVTAALIAGMAGCNGGSSNGVVEQIYDWNGLDAIRHNPGRNYLLMDNLHKDSNGYDDLVKDQDGGWQPIGDKYAPFTGTFDGNGKTIKDLVIIRPGDDDVGLFGYVRKGEIKNIAVVDADVRGREQVGVLVGYNWQGDVLSDPGGLAYSTNSAGNVTGEDKVGGLVGYNYLGTVGISRSSATVSSDKRAGGLVGDNLGTVTQSRYYGEVTGSWQVGGLVGLNGVRGRVLASDGTNTVTVTGDTFVGGVAGANYGLTNGSKFAGQVISPRNADSLVLLNEATVSNLRSTASVAVGSYVGGVVGFNEGSVDDCSSSGSVTGISYVGGLVGGNEGTVDSCSSSGSVTGISYVGGLVGGNDGTVDSCSSSGSVTGESAVGKLVGYNTDTGTVTNSDSTSCVTGAVDCGPLVGEDSGSAAPLPEYRLTIHSTTGGSVTAPGEGTFSYDAGAVVFLAAEAEEGYRFVNWTARASEGYLAGSFGDAHAATTTFTMPDEDVTVTANFVSPLTHLFYGTVSVADERAPEGTLVQAFVDSMKTAETTVDAEGRYALLVPGTPGAIVTFRVDGLLANESGTWQSGKIDDDFDLTVDLLPATE